jgi:DNA-directed RNA polymerase specialized sigma24 family protein
VDEWGTAEAQAAIAAVYGERLVKAVIRQCRKQAREHGGGDRFRDYVSVALERGLDPDRTSLLDKDPGYVSVAVRNAIHDAERHDYITTMTAKHQEKEAGGRYVKDIAYGLVSTKPDEGNLNSPFDTITADLAWRNTVIDDSDTDSRLAEYRDRFKGAFARIRLAEPVKAEAFLLVVGEGYTYKRAGEVLEHGQATIHRWVKAVTAQLQTDLDAKPKRKRRRKRQPGRPPTEAELATLAGLLRVDPVTAMLARKAAFQSGKIPPIHRGAKVTVTRGQPRGRARRLTPLGMVAIGYSPLNTVCGWCQSIHR